MSDYQPLTQTATSYTTTTTSGSQSHGIAMARIPLGNLHDLVNNSSLNSSDGFCGQRDGLSVSGAGCEGVRDVHGGGVAPNTPQRAAQTNPVTPLTPLANLKVLMAAAAASSAMEGKEGGEEGRTGSGGEVLVKGEEGGGGGGEEGGTASRKMKSLALLCQRFLGIVESDIGTGNDFSLDMMAHNLGTNRRRIYDIINVLEAVEMIVKQSKNWYTWTGRGGLLATLAKLKAMAGDDSELTQWFRADGGKENVTPPTVSVSKQQGQSSMVHDENSQDSLADELPCDDGQTRGGRWDKSLGVLCQKFIMLFLISPTHELTLDLAGTILMPDDYVFTPGHPAAATSSKTKVRRLYDIANVLTTLGLIKKKTFLAPNHRKLPGYTWCGPTAQEIDVIPVCRKTDFSSGTVYSKKMKGTSLVRKPSVGGRPFLHQYEVKDSNSAPNTPCKRVPTTKPLGGWPVGNFTGGRGGGSIRRSLSFGGQTSARMSATPNGGCGQGRRVGGAWSEERQATASPVLVRPLCPKAVDYMNEVREFEMEMRKHSHRYPNVVTVFQEFIQRYQSSLEQAAVSGRAILPKPPSPPSLPLQDPHLHPLTNSTDPQEYLTPQIPSNVNKNLETSLDLSHFVSNPLTAANVPSSTVPPSADQQAQVIALPLEDAALQSTVPGLNVTFISSLSNVVSISQSTTTVSVSRMNCEAVQATPTAVSQSITVAPSVGPASQPQPHCTGLMAITENTMAADSSTHSQHQHQTASMVSCIPARSSLIFDTPASESAAPQMVTPSPSHPHHNEHSQHGLLSEHQQLMPSVEITEVMPKGFERESQNDTVSSSLLPPALQETQQATTITCALTQDSVPQMSGSESQQLTDSHPGTGNLHQSRIALPNSIVNFSPAPLSLYGFTQGTIQSPEKPAHANAQAFVRVEDFLSVLAAQTPRGKNPLQESVKLDPHTGLVATTQSSLLRSPPSGVQPLVNLSILSQLLNMPQPSIPDTVKAAVVGAPSTSRHSTPLQANLPGSLVNQRPISATGEVIGKKKSVVSAGTGDAKSNFKLLENSVSTPQNNSLPSSPYLPVVPPQISTSGLPLGFTNPNTLLSNPPRFLPRQTLTPNTTPGFIPLVPNFSLPPFSTLCVPSATSSEPAAATMQHPPDASASDESPPKRVKLE